MKKILLLFTIIIWTSFFSQEVEGIGVFKLGKFSENDLLSLGKSKAFKLTDCDSPNCFRSSDLVNILPNKTDIYLSPPFSSYSKNVTVYKLSDFMINEKYRTDYLILSFYNKILYSVYAYMPAGSLTDDLKIKYGEPLRTHTTGKDKCRIGNESFELPREIFFQNWFNKDKGFEMFYILRSGRDSDCEENITYSLTLFDSKIDKKSKQENDDEVEKVKSLIESQKKESLKDL